MTGEDLRADDMHEVKIRYSEPLLREAVYSFVFRAIIRQFGAGFFILCGIIAAATAYLIARHDRSWVVGFLIATVLFVLVIFAMLFVAHYRNTVGKFRQMRTPEATFAYNEQQFTVSSELGSATMPWESITEVWRYPRFWLLLFSRSQFITLPLDSLDEQTRNFIARKVAKQASEGSR